MANKLIDLTGKKFGKLRVTNLDRMHKKHGSYWLCNCDCGEKGILVRGTHLRSGGISSCKCFHKEQTHRKSWTGHEEISGQLWSSICRNAKIRKKVFKITIKDAWKQYKKQGGKCALTGLDLKFKRYHHKENGLTIYTKGDASLDRIDSSKGYLKSNIQWVHRSVNLMKHILPEDELYRLCRLIVNKRDTNE